MFRVLILNGAILTLFVNVLSYAEDSRSLEEETAFVRCEAIHYQPRNCDAGGTLLEVFPPDTAISPLKCFDEEGTFNSTLCPNGVQLSKVHCFSGEIPSSYGWGDRYVSVRFGCRAIFRVKLLRDSNGRN